MGAVTYRFLCELRARWRAWLVLAMLVGAVAGTSLALLAGSRRTGSAYARFVTAHRAFDVALAVSCTRDSSPDADVDTSCYDAVAHLPAVAGATTVSELPAFVETLDGQSVQPDRTDGCYSGPGLVAVIFDASGRYGTTINRRRFVAGRPANPRSPDEVVISQETAHRLALGPGSELRIRLFDGADCTDRKATWRAPRRVRVVGVQLSPGEVRPPSGFYLQTVEVTPAFVDGAGVVPDRSESLLARLRPRATSDALRSQAHEAGYKVDVALSQADSARAIERAIRPNEVSLAILAALIAVAGAAVLGQILVRHAFIESADDTLLSALGMRRRDRVALAALRGSTMGIVAAVIASVAVVATSPLLPIGLARRVEPAPGIAVDASVLGIGVLVTVLFVVVVTAATAGRLAMKRGRDVPVKRSTLAGVAARAGFSPAAVSGTSFALERGGGRTAVPVASSFAGLTIAVVAIIGALTFGASLTHLRTTPRLVGWNWDLVLVYPEVEDPTSVPAVAARARARDAFAARGVTDVAIGMVWSPFPDGRDLQLGPERRSVGGFIALDGSARLGPSVISGRKPSAADEIMLGPRTLAALGLRVGDSVDVVGQAGTWQDPGEETSTRMRIVGTGLSPMSESLGRGATLTIEGVQRLSAEATEQALFVRLEPGADREAAFETFRAAFPDEPRTSMDSFEFESLPDDGLNLEQIGSVPALFAVIMGAMAAAVLAHVLAAGARARRRDLAVLRALGFSRGQTLRTIAWQSMTYAVGALVIGSPLGVVLGRFVWHIYAANLGVVPEAVTPWSAWAAIIAATLALAGVLAIAPALRIARTRPAEVLRTE